MNWKANLHESYWLALPFISRALGGSLFPSGQTSEIEETCAKVVWEKQFKY